jgi:hypothetical protein
VGGAELAFEILEKVKLKKKKKKKNWRAKLKKKISIKFKFLKFFRKNMVAWKWPF